jgi:hypothetical protein
MLFGPILVLGILAVLATVVFQGQRRHARTDALISMAMDLRLEFSMLDTFGIETMPFALFRQGKGQKAENVIWGTYNGAPVKLFDYEYYVDGRSREYHRFTCAYMTLPMACPALCLTHENVFTRIGDHLGMHDVELEYDDFNRRFKVSGEQTFAFTMLDGQMMEWLLGADGFDRVEVVGPWVLVVRPRLEPATWPKLGLWLEEFHQHIPALVYTTYPPQ